MKKGKLTNHEKSEILRKMGQKTFSAKKMAKELNRSEAVVSSFIANVITPQNIQMPEAKVVPVNDKDATIKQLQDRIIQMEQEIHQPNNQWKGKVRVMTQAHSERLDEALGRNPNSNRPTTVQPDTYRPDCVIKPLGNE